MFIGGAPRTELAGRRRGPGRARLHPDRSRRCWPTAAGRRAGAPDRDPYFLETSLPGVFVAGDVRSESVKRVASAVGEGAMAVTLVHRYLGER